jgi:catechol 2,3-dioxygenase-like lactoylglutathione lyase family enzyme
MDRIQIASSTALWIGLYSTNYHNQVMAMGLNWGHININVSNLEASISFYEKLGFQSFLPGIPYLNLSRDSEATVPDDAARALGMRVGSRGRACIMQLDHGFPKIDLTESSENNQREPLSNQDLGLVRICLVSEDLAGDYEALRNQGVRFLHPPAVCHERLADVAVCVDPDGALIEILQVYLDRWGPFLG